MNILDRAILHSKRSPRVNIAEPHLESDVLKHITEDRIRKLEYIVGRIVNELAIPINDSAQVFPSVRRIIAEIAKYYGVPANSLIGVCRKKELVRPRHVAMYLAKRLTIQSYPTIARVFDRDHTTVIHAVEKIERMRKVDAVLDQDIAVLSREIIKITSPAP